MQHVEQRLRHIEVVGADVLATRWVVVVDHGDVLVGIGLGAQGKPAAGTAGEAVDFGGQDDGRAGFDAGQLVRQRLAQG